MGLVARLLVTVFVVMAGGTYWLVQSPDSFAEYVPSEAHGPFVKSAELLEGVGVGENSTDDVVSKLDEVRLGLKNLTVERVVLGQIPVDATEWKACVDTAECVSTYGAEAVCHEGLCVVEVENVAQI